MYNLQVLDKFRAAHPILDYLFPVVYVIVENPDKTELGMTSEKSYLASPKLQFDTNDRPMVIKYRFRAVSYNAAMRKYYKLYDLGTYKPF